MLIPIAKSINYEKREHFKGEFIIEPLYPGYGTTLGNALRRVLLSSIPGAAVTSVKINGVQHEFSTISYVKEDVVDILLNIKQVNLKIDGEIDPTEPLVIKIAKSGEGKVTAKDFKCPSQVKIANPELHLATLTDKAASLEIECQVGKGLGYVPVESRMDEKLDIGHIAVDAVYTPIDHINVETEHVRVGEMTNWDKLILTVETNGTISCEDAYKIAVDILVNQFTALKGENKIKAEKEPTIKETEVKIEEVQKEPMATAKAEPEEPVEDKPKKKRGRPRKEDK